MNDRFNTITIKCQNGNHMKLIIRFGDIGRPFRGRSKFFLIFKRFQVHEVKSSFSALLRKKQRAEIYFVRLVVKLKNCLFFGIQDFSASQAGINSISQISTDFALRDHRFCPEEHLDLFAKYRNRRCLWS